MNTCSFTVRFKKTSACSKVVARVHNLFWRAQRDIFFFFNRHLSLMEASLDTQKLRRVSSTSTLSRAPKTLDLTVTLISHHKEIYHSIHKFSTCTINPPLLNVIIIVAFSRSFSPPIMVAKVVDLDNISSSMGHR